MYCVARGGEVGAGYIFDLTCGGGAGAAPLFRRTAVRGVAGVGRGLLEILLLLLAAAVVAFVTPLGEEDFVPDGGDGALGRLSETESEPLWAGCEAVEAI